MKVLAGILLGLLLVGAVYNAIANRYVYVHDEERIDRWTRKTEQWQCILPGGISLPAHMMGMETAKWAGCIDHAWREVK